MKKSGDIENFLLVYFRSVASERDLSHQEVVEIFAESLAQAAKRNVLELRDADVRVALDAQTGRHESFRRWRVLADDAEIENEEAEITLSEARKKADDAGLAEGDIIEEPVEVDFNSRVTMQSAKQHFQSNLRDAERSRLMQKLLEKDEVLVTGQVTRVLRDKGDAIVEVMKVDCRLPKSEMLPRESFKTGDRVQALIKETDSETRGRQVVLSRTSPDFLRHLFRRVVPEIEKGILEIVSVARDPGNRAKIAVRSDDPRVDPVGTCVGIRGSRVQAVTNEMGNERVDIVPWSEDPATFVLRALAPAEVTRINVDQERRMMDVVIHKDAMALAIGRNGANVRLAKDLTGWHLELHTPEEYDEKSEQTTKRKSERLAAALNLEADAARVLCEEGFDTADSIAYADATEINAIGVFNPEVAADIQQRAKDAVAAREEEMSEKLDKIDERLAALQEMDDQILYDLVDNNIFTLADFADLSSDELLDISEVDSARAGRLILEARALTAAEEEGEESESENAAGSLAGASGATPQ
jgi:N utilization substance protein A